MLIVFWWGCLAAVQVMPLRMAVHLLLHTLHSLNSTMLQRIPVSARKARDFEMTRLPQGWGGLNPEYLLIMIKLSVPLPHEPPVLKELET